MNFKVLHIDTTLWFDDLPVIGKISLSEAAHKLREVDEIADAEVLESVENIP